ncbi:MAG TPA: sigma-70 family RNA polymerase sigma factor [Polyangiaceae bacterium]|nr:sigma-70 family RNA polymerase sigma factor [Polyangiaceae bacterium]
MLPSRLRLVTPLPEAPVDEAEALGDLVAGLRMGRPSAQRQLLERFSPFVERVLTRILGVTSDLEDLEQEVFVRVFERVGELREATALRGFVASVAVFVAREALRAKRRRWWLFFMAPEATPDIELVGIDAVAREAVRAFYEVVGKLPEDERIAFCLRYVEGMELTELAAVCACSVSTIKRRLRAAEVRFARWSAQRAELVDLLEEGTRWPKSKR